eukprot:352054-Chlamydomonas_euryale.AAC.1
MSAPIPRPSPPQPSSPFPKLLTDATALSSVVHPCCAHSPNMPTIDVTYFRWSAGTMALRVWGIGCGAYGVGRRVWGVRCGAQGVGEGREADTRAPCTHAATGAAICTIICAARCMAVRAASLPASCKRKLLWHQTCMPPPHTPTPPPAPHPHSFSRLRCSPPARLPHFAVGGNEALAHDEVEQLREDALAVLARVGHQDLLRVGVVRNDNKRLGAERQPEDLAVHLRLGVPFAKGGAGTPWFATSPVLVPELGAASHRVPRPGAHAAK